MSSFYLGLANIVGCGPGHPVSDAGVGRHADGRVAGAEQGGGRRRRHPTAAVGGGVSLRRQIGPVPRGPETDSILFWMKAIKQLKTVNSLFLWGASNSPPPTRIL